nr:hypothetical protein [Planosporangium mesophilum]
MPNVRFRSTLSLAVLLAVAVLVGILPAGPVRAEPATPGPEGGGVSLRDQLDAAAKGFNDATARLETSKARQAQLTEQMRATDAAMADVTAQIGEVAARAYKSGRVSGLAVLVDSESPTGLLQRATALETRVRLDDAQLRRLNETAATQRRQQAALDNEIKVQQAQVAEMAKRKQAAEKALAPVGGGQKVVGPGSGGGFVPTGVPRRADGTLAPESCSADDPTTSGCLTPRTLHAYQQTKAAGFNHFVSCYRPQEDGGEHPRGRACDWAASAGGFGGVATGADRDYGNRLAAWYVANAQRLGVLYVIWFRQIWLPSTGWRAYRNGDGTPSGDHTNHVHLSVQ